MNPCPRCSSHTPKQRDASIHHSCYLIMDESLDSKLSSMNSLLATNTEPLPPMFSKSNTGSEINMKDDKYNLSEAGGDSNVLNPNPFRVLPPEMLAEIMLYFDPKFRQKLRTVSRFWKFVVEKYYGISLTVNNLNWNAVESCSCAKTVILNGFSRDVRHPEVITERLTKLIITDIVAYYSFMPILEECYTLEYLEINSVTFLQKSRLAEYNSIEYLDERTEGWLPKLKTFKFISCTTKGGVYNHVLTVPEALEDAFGSDDVTRTTFDISRGEMEFIPFILQILAHASSLAHVEMTLTDIWKLSFGDILQVSAPDTPPALALDVSSWHFGSKRLLPIVNLVQKVKSLTTLSFNFPYHFDTFFIKFHPVERNQTTRSKPFQLEEVSVHQSFRWSQEMSQMDMPWLEILGSQTALKSLEYPFPIYTSDDRMAEVIMRNCKTLEKISFTGHREDRGLLDYDHIRGGHMTSWDAQWFISCETLQELSLKANTRFILTPTNMAKMENVHLLPNCLKHFTLHGCIDTKNIPLANVFSGLVSLQTFSHQARLCPWYKIEGLPVIEMQISHAMDVIMSLPSLMQWTLEWYDSTSTVLAQVLMNSEVPSQSAYLSAQLIDWIGDRRDNFKQSETIVDRSVKSFTITVLSRDFLNA